MQEVRNKHADYIAWAYVTVVGEEVTLYLADATQTVAIRARVVESRLDAVKGDALQQVRLARLEGTSARTITASE